MTQEQLQPERLSPETLETGIIDAGEYQLFSPEQGKVVPVYSDQDIGLTMWNLEPGQENSAHSHPDFGQILIVMRGSGEALRGEELPPLPIKAGMFFIAPRGAPHGIRNTGSERLSYVTASNRTGSGYTREPIGEQKVSFGHP
jgi:quercetin dioxygenase-like cupin family protein